MATARLSSAGRHFGLHHGRGRSISNLLSNRLSASSARSYSALSRSQQTFFSKRIQHSSLGASVLVPRYASTAATSAAAPEATPASISLDPAAASSTPSNTGDFASTFDIGTAPVVDLSPHKGYLAELGLDYGWGPTSIVQWTIETIQVAGDLPMWGSVIAAVLLTRVMLLPIFIRAADTTGKLATMQPLLRPLMNRLKEAQLTGDQMEIQKAQLETKAFLKQADIRYLSIFMPMFIQGPLGYGMFRLTRGMASLPLPELQTTQLGWLTDLSVHDPYFLLPIITSGTLYLTIKSGGEQGEAAMGRTPMVAKLLRYGMPALSFIFTSFMPAVTQIGFFAGSAWGFVQARLFKNPSMRRLLRMHPLPTPGSTPPNADAIERAYKGTINTTARVKEQASAATPTTGFAGLKSKFTAATKDGRAGLKQMSSKVNEFAERRQKKKHGRLTEAELRSATTYEERRRKAEAADREAQQEVEREQRARRMARRNK